MSGPPRGELVLMGAAPRRGVNPNSHAFGILVTTDRLPRIRRLG
jgi:hypothetical protein